MDLPSSCLYTPSTFVSSSSSSPEVPNIQNIAFVSEKLLEVTTDAVYAFTTQAFVLLPTLPQFLGLDTGMPGINNNISPEIRDDLYVPILAVVSISFRILLFLLASGVVGSVFADFPQLITVLFHRDASGLSMTALSTKLFALSICFAKLLLMCLRNMDDDLQNNKNNNINSNFQGGISSPMSNLTNSFFSSLDFLQVLPSASNNNLGSASPSERTSLLLFTATCGACAAMMQTLLLLLSISVFNQTSSRWPKFSLAVWFLSGTCGLVLLIACTPESATTSSVASPSFSSMITHVVEDPNISSSSKHDIPLMDDYHQYRRRNDQNDLECYSAFGDTESFLQLLTSEESKKKISENPLEGVMLAKRLTLKASRKFLCEFREIRLTVREAIAEPIVMNVLKSSSKTKSEETIKMCRLSGPAEFIAELREGCLPLFNLMDSILVVLVTMIEYFAFVCCMLSPVWFWYFNYKHKATRRFSKVSQILHSFFSFVGVLFTGLVLYFYDDLFLQQDNKNSSSTFRKALIGNLVVGVWHFLFHLAMIFQVISSDRDDAIMKQRFAKRETKESN